nr:MAG TPA: hypothetical protein [Caudoviricetes sp.]
MAGFIILFTFIHTEFITELYNIDSERSLNND